MKKYTIFIFMISFIAIWCWAAPSFTLQDPQDIRLIFSHQLHIEENEIECQTCHTKSEESITGSEDLLPTRAICGNCHDVDDEDNCKTCHGKMIPRALPRIQDYKEQFSHKKHIESGQDCQKCHEDKIHKNIILPYILPDMNRCIECHRAEAVTHRCETCHIPEEIQKPVNHTSDFIHSHGDLGKNESIGSSEKSCSTCHEPPYCQNCHEGDNLDRKTHPLNFQFTHALKAQGKEMECSVCHTEKQFCIECHRDNNVLPHNHTAGWAITNVGGRHRDEAINDLESCMACHEQNAELICQKCHIK